MNKLAVVIIAVLIIAGFLLFKDKTVAPTGTEIDSNMPVPGSNVDEIEVVETSNQSEMKEFSIDASNFSFYPSSITVNKGDTVKISVTNALGIHDLKIDEFAGASTKILKAGESQTITFVADKSGTFEFYCSVGSHRQMGMVGKLTVN